MSWSLSSLASTGAPWVGVVCFFRHQLGAKYPRIFVKNEQTNRKKTLGAGEKAQQLEAVVAFVEGSDLMVAQTTYNSRGSNTLF